MADVEAEPEGGGGDHGQRDARPERHVQGRETEHDDRAEGHELGVGEVGDAGGTEHERESDGREGEHQAEAQAADHALHELVEEARDVSLPSPDEEVDRDATARADVDFLVVRGVVTLLDHGDALGEGLLVEGDRVVGVALGHPDRPLALDIRDDIGIDAVAGRR